MTLVRAAVHNKSSSTPLMTYKVLNNMGDISLGFEDIDERVANQILTERIRAVSSSTSNDADTGEPQLKSTAKDINLLSVMMLVGAVKSALSVRESVSIDLARFETHFDGDGHDSRRLARITRDLVKNEICRDIYDWSMIHVKRCLTEAGLDIDDSLFGVDSVLLLIDETKMPGFGEHFRKTFGGETLDVRFIGEHEIGLAGLKIGMRRRARKLVTQDVVCRSIGVGLYNGAVNFLVPRNTQLPYTCELQVGDDLQPIEFYEGERPHVKYCKYIGKLVSIADSNSPGRYGFSDSLKLEISVDAEGILSIKPTSDSKNTDSFVWFVIFNFYKQQKIKENF